MISWFSITKVVSLVAVKINVKKSHFKLIFDHRDSNEKESSEVNIHGV